MYLQINECTLFHAPLYVSSSLLTHSQTEEVVMDRKENGDSSSTLAPQPTFSLSLSLHDESNGVEGTRTSSKKKKTPDEMSQDSSNELSTKPNTTFCKMRRVMYGQSGGAIT